MVFVFLQVQEWAFKFAELEVVGVAVPDGARRRRRISRPSLPRLQAGGIVTARGTRWPEESRGSIACCQPSVEGWCRVPPAGPLLQLGPLQHPGTLDRPAARICGGSSAGRGTGRNRAHALAADKRTPAVHHRHLAQRPARRSKMLIMNEKIILIFLTSLILYCTF